MASPLAIDARAMTDFLVGLLNTPSPTGFAEPGIAYVEQAFSGFPLRLRRTPKGALVAAWEGRSNAEPRALTAHVDTLGAMVREIKSNGRLKLTRIGGFAWKTMRAVVVIVVLLIAIALCWSGWTAWIDLPSFP